MMALVGSSATAAQSGLNPTNRLSVNQRTYINDIPAHLLTDHVFPYLSTEDTHNFLSSRFDHIKSIIKIWNPKRRFKLLKKALENNDPAFDDNYLLRYAAAKGMKDVVELLLNYSSVDPAAKNNWALILAKENKYDKVFDLLAQRLPENDIETGQLNLPNSSHAILLDLIHAEPGVDWEEMQQQRDLQLLLDTSTKILPYLEDSISVAIRLGKTELAKMMLFFVAFDDSYFNNMVLIKQLRCGNSVTDIRKINPFRYGDDSIFVQAVRSGNVDLANLILDKALTLNPLAKGSTCWNMGNLERAYDIAFEISNATVPNSEMASLKDRLRTIFSNDMGVLLIFLFSAFFSAMTIIVLTV
jgi:hypothetical protein